MRGIAGVFAVLVATTSAFSIEKPSVQTIVERSVAAENADWAAQPGYNFMQTERDDDGPANTYRVMMILGSRYRELTAVNGQPLSQAAQAQQKQVLQQEIARRQRETPDQRAQRIAAYRKNRDQEHTMLLQMAKAFNFHEAGEQEIDGHKAWVLDATPRAGYQPPNQRAKVLTGMRGRLWIAKDGYHWLKVRAQVVQPVHFIGFLASVGPGTWFEMEKAPAGNGVWLPVHFAMNVQAKILGLFPHNSKEDDRFWDYKPTAPLAAIRAALR
jgi:hypothetical protein